ncbi:MAG: polysaccharide deacetylase family protein [Sulfurimonas sp.]|nr:polysaccharide deacetylase family protein [Sulfurimonas sp.]
MIRILWRLMLLSLLTTTLYAKSDAVVFMYHHFGEDRFPSTNIKLKQFQEQLDYLEDNNYNVWPLSKIIRHIQNKMQIPSKTVALTIDDAYISIYTHAYPMLKKKRFPFTVFVNTRPIGHNSINYMTWDHMREMQRYGAEFANHSSTHDYLTPKKDESSLECKSRIKQELSEAQSRLQEELGMHTNQNPKIFSYPFGEYTQETAKYIESLGYVGVSQTSGAISESSDLRRLPRFAMSEAFANIEDFKLKLGTLDLPLRSVTPWEPVISSNPPRLKVVLQKSLKNFSCYISSGEKIAVKKISEVEFEVQSSEPLEGPRDRYTCTAVDEDKQWYWYSHLWIIK